MASITIRNIDDRLKRKLRIRAATHGRSMEDEAREILRTALREPTPSNLAYSIRARIQPVVASSWRYLPANLSALHRISARHDGPRNQSELKSLTAFVCFLTADVAATLKRPNCQSLREI